MRNHYVPRFYLKGFARRETLWAYDREARRSFQTKVSSVAYEHEMYSDELERFLATKIEDPAKSAIKKLRARELIEAQERWALATYIVLLRKRVPQGRARAIERLPEIADEVHYRLNVDLDRFVELNPGLFSQAERRRGEIAAIIAEKKRGPSIDLWNRSIQSRPSSEVVDALLSMNWVLLYGSEGEFLTCDNPVWISEAEGIARPTSELTLPISDSLALWANRQPRPSIQFRAASSHRVREINRRTVQNASRFVFAPMDKPWILRFVLRSHSRPARLR